MNYLLFISFNSGLKHNASHATLQALRESVEQLIAEERAELENGKLPNLRELKKHINRRDDYAGYLSNGTWFHIQPQNVFEAVK